MVVDQEENQTRGAAAAMDEEAIPMTRTIAETKQERRERQRKEREKLRNELRVTVFSHGINGVRVRTDANGVELSADKYTWYTDDDGNPQRNDIAPQELTTSGQLPRGKFYCKACDVSFKGSKRYQAHRKEKQHKLILNEYKAAKNSKISERYRIEEGETHEKAENERRLGYALYYIAYLKYMGESLHQLDIDLYDSREQKASQLDWFAIQM